MINQEIYYKNVGGLYKVRVGSFNVLSDAVSLLEQMKSLGFNDSFVVELTYLQTIEK
jgi:cell division protein FtsN